MLIGDIVRECAAQCTEDTPVEKVYELIQTSPWGFAVVLDSSTHRVPLGIVSEHSLCEQVFGKDRNPRGLMAGSVIDPRIKKIDESTPLGVCRGMLAGGRHWTAVLAVDGKGAFRGVVPLDVLKTIPISAFSKSGISPAVVAATPAASEIPSLGWIQ